MCLVEMFTLNSDRVPFIRGSTVLMCLPTHVSLCSVFIGVSDREESHYNIRMLKEKKRIDDDFANYKEWLTRASTFRNTVCLAKKTQFDILD